MRHKEPANTKNIKKNKSKLFLFHPHPAAYATMCNIRQFGDSRRPYGQDALVASPVHEYEISPDYDFQSPSPDSTLPFYDDYEAPRSE